MEFTTGVRLEVRITASDVGKRVSVRSLTGLGGGGPKFTDTVGVLTSWTDGVLRITRRDGERVELRESGLVAAKVVPAAPARRRGIPAADARGLQRVAARGWPALETEQLGEWTLRASVTPRAARPAAGGGGRREGFTSRGNSVLPLGDPGRDLDDALERVTRWYADRGLPAKVQVVETAEGTEGAGSGYGYGAGDLSLAAALDRRGWTADRHARLCTAALAPLADRARDDRVRVHRELDEEWLRGYGRAGATAGEAARQVLGGGPSVWFATVHGTGGRPAAIGRCVVDGRWAGFAAVEVHPEHRREGLATAVMAELARAALAEGASAAYLQVETDNERARVLYEGLGFADHHAYHYRTAPGH